MGSLKDIRNYRYYDTPEGTDIEKKIFAATRFGVTAGVILSTYDVLMYSHAVKWGAILKRYARHTVPFALMGATFAAVSNKMVVWREKNDIFNYFVGGLACGPLLAYYLGSYHGLVVGGLALGIIGAVKRDSIEQCYELYPNTPSHMGTIWRWRRDFTMATDPRDTHTLKDHVCEWEDE